MAFTVGNTFESFFDFEMKFKAFQAANNILFVKKSSRKLSPYHPDTDRLVYEFAAYSCKQGKVRASESKGIRPNQSTLKCNCTAFLRIATNKSKADGHINLKITGADHNHTNHPVDKKTASIYPENRRPMITDTVRAMAVNSSKKTLKAYLEDSQSLHLTSRDMSNLKRKLSSDSSDRCWERVSQKVSHQCNKYNTAEALRKKLKNLQRAIDRQQNNANGSGDGGEVVPSRFMEQMMSFIESASAVLDCPTASDTDGSGPQPNTADGDPSGQANDFKITFPASSIEEQEDLSENFTSDSSTHPSPHVSTYRSSQSCIVHVSSQQQSLQESAQLPLHTSTPLPPQITIEQSPQNFSHSASDNVRFGICLGARMRAAENINADHLYYRPESSVRKPSDNSIFEEWCQSEIDKNKSIIEANASLVEYHKAQIDLINFQMGKSTSSQDH